MRAIIASTMSNSTIIAAESLRASRVTLGVSYSRLARTSDVNRFKICLFELGNGSLTLDEQSPVRQALQAEADYESSPKPAEVK